MIGRAMVPAVGAERRVPAPDPIAREYLLLVLRLDQRVPGLVDGYFWQLLALETHARVLAGERPG